MITVTGSSVGIYSSTTVELREGYLKSGAVPFVYVTSGLQIMSKYKFSHNFLVLQRKYIYIRAVIYISENEESES